mmetsp:Transcript_12446/g.35900  ORF Transcript_12446/g.35900 Transcript_12446/m.35900 type:complete len:173 (+) Transcript_12446:816-1334(+)
MLQIDTHLRTGTIPGLDAQKRHKVHELFMARWEYFHVLVMTAAYCLEPEFCRRKFSSNEQKELRMCFRQMATREHPYPDILAEYSDFQEACISGFHDLNDEVAFSNRARVMASYKWANIYLASWPRIFSHASRVQTLPPPRGGKPTATASPLFSPPCAPRTAQALPPLTHSL